MQQPAPRHPPTSEVDTEVELRFLVTPPRQAKPEEVRRSVRVAHQLGRAFGERFAHCVTCLVSRGVKPRPNEWAYYTCVVEPGLAGEPDPSRIEEWRESFASGEAMHDPRVRAFQEGLSERALETADTIHRRQCALATFLEASPEQVAMTTGTPDEPVCFLWGERHFLVTSAPEDVAGAAARALAGCPAAEEPAAARTGIEQTRCLGYHIFSWRSPPDGGPAADA